MFKLKHLLAIATASFFFMTAGHAQDSKTYTTLETPVPTSTQGKVEVLEFFSYTCVHCSATEPLLEKWLPTLPKDKVEFIRVPVAFNAAMEPTQKFYYVLQALNRLDLHAKLFKAIHQDHQPIYTKEALIDWGVKQGIKKEDLTATYDSFGVTSKAKRATELTDLYKIDGTPSMAVNGKYVTSPSQAQSYQGMIDTAQQLINKELQTH